MNPKFKVIIADDEPLVRKRIASLIEPHREFHIVAQTSSGEKTIDALKKYSPDILFLDIKMPKGDGFSVLNKINNENLLIIFITAYDEYAVLAFEFEAFDYILKPITRNRFEKTLQRLKKSLLSNQTKQKAITVEINKELSHVALSQVTHIEADDNYIKIHYSGGYYKKRMTIKSIADQLIHDNFTRVHRSYIVNQAHVTSIVKLSPGEYLIKLSSGRIIPTARSYKKIVQELLF